MLWGHGRARQRNISMLRVAFCCFLLLLLASCCFLNFLLLFVVSCCFLLLLVASGIVGTSFWGRPGGHTTHGVGSWASAPRDMEARRKQCCANSVLISLWSFATRPASHGEGSLSVTKILSPTIAPACEQKTPPHTSGVHRSYGLIIRHL